MHHRRYLSRVLFCFALVSSSFGFKITNARESEDDNEKITAEQIHLWIGDLDSDSFVTREFATENLPRAGVDCIDPLLEALPKSSLEVMTRGIHVLREVALSDDLDTENAARAALEQVARSRHKTLSGRASSTLAGLDTIRHNRAIKQLQKLGANFNAGDLPFARFASALYSIELGDNWQGTAKDLTRLKWLQEVRQLTMSGEKFTDEHVKYIAEMENLNDLTIKRAAITNGSLSHLKKLKNIARLSIMYCPIDDMSIDHLLDNRNVTTMRLFGTRITKDGAARLQKELASTEIDHRDGGFLGIGGEATEHGLEITIIHPTSVANKEGLRVGDLVVKYDGQKVEDFKNLTKLIGANRTGDDVTIELMRAGETITKRIKLGEWE